MALFGTGSLADNLEGVLTNKADLGASQLQDQAAQRRKKLIGQQAHAGRLMSGSSNYNLADADAAEASGIGDVYSGLAGALGGIPAEDMLDTNQYNRDLSLAELIGRLNKPSKLQEGLGALGPTGSMAATIAAFA